MARATVLENHCSPCWSVSSPSRSLCLQINQNKLPTRAVESRVISRGPDFTPAFADFGRQMSGGRSGAAVSHAHAHVITTPPPDTNTTPLFLSNNVSCLCVSHLSLSHALTEY